MIILIAARNWQDAFALTVEGDQYHYCAGFCLAADTVPKPSAKGHLFICSNVNAVPFSFCHS